TATSVESILKELSAKDVQVLNLLALYRPDRNEECSPLWLRDPRLHIQFGRAMLGEGQPAYALELVCRGLQSHPNDPDLLYLRALALARGGNISRAEALAREVLQLPGLEPRLQVEALSLVGRLDKD